MTIVSQELLPCPFCGGDAIIVNEDRSWIECADCPSKAEVGPFNCEAEAITAWNHRINSAKPTDADVDEASRVARAIAPVVLPYVEGYEEVPPDHIWSRPRYEWLGLAMVKIANAAIAALSTPPPSEDISDTGKL